MLAPVAAAPRADRRFLRRLHVAGLLAALACALPAQTWRHGVTSAAPARDVAVSTGGRVVVVRSDQNEGGLTLFDASGDMLRHLELFATSGEPVRPSAAAFVDEAAVIVVGSLGGRPWVARVDPQTGASAWSRTLTRAPQLGGLDKVVINELGHAVVSGALYDQVLDQQTFTAAVNPANGAVHYRRLPEGNRIRSLTSAQNGDLLSTTSDGVVVLTRSTNWGAPIWQKRLSGDLPLYNARVAETTSGELMVVGVVNTTGSVYDSFALKTTASGDPLWFRTFASFPATSFGKTQDVLDAVATPDGGVVAAISQPMPGNGSRDGALLKLDADGEVQWLRAFGQPGHDEIGVGVHLTPDGGFVAASDDVGGGFFAVRVTSDGTTGGCELPLLSVTPLLSSQLVSWPQTASYENYDGLWQSEPVVSVGGSPLHLTTCVSSCEILGNSYGVGTAGSGQFTPRLTAHDGVCLGYTPELELDLALGGAPGLLFLGFGDAQLPGLGGSFLVDPSPMKVFMVHAGGAAGVPGAGAFSIPLGTDLTYAQGITVYLQAVFADPAGPSGKALSNGVRFRIL